MSLSPAHPSRKSLRTGGPGGDALQCAERGALVCECYWGAKLARLFRCDEFHTQFRAVLIWYFGGLQVIGGGLTFGTLWAFTSLFYQLYQPLQFFSQINNFISRAFAGAERFSRFLTHGLS